MLQNEYSFQYIGKISSSEKAVIYSVSVVYLKFEYFHEAPIGTYDGRLMDLYPLLVL